jgi:hypothetical protein
MYRNLQAWMTDLRAWLIQLGVTVIECVFVGCGVVLLPALIPCRTPRPLIHDPFR